MYVGQLFDDMILYLFSVSRCVQLKALHLHQNAIDTIEGLNALSELDTLNLSNNYITKVEGLEGCRKLRTIQLAGNQLKAAGDLEGLLACPELSILDLSANQLSEPEILDVLERIPDLRVLNLMGNDVVKKIPNYRKAVLNRIKTLTYLDDKPVFEDERRCVNAWGAGGRDAEVAERDAIKEEAKERDRRNMEAFHKMVEEAREKKRRERREAGLPEEEEEEDDKEVGENGQRKVIRDVDWGEGEGRDAGQGDGQEDDLPDLEYPDLAEVVEAGKRQKEEAAEKEKENTASTASSAAFAHSSGGGGSNLNTATTAPGLSPANIAPAPAKPVKEPVVISSTTHRSGLKIEVLEDVQPEEEEPAATPIAAPASSTTRSLIEEMD